MFYIRNAAIHKNLLFFPVYFSGHTHIFILGQLFVFATVIRFQGQIMFIPKANRIAVFTYLFSEGVLVVKKDTVSNKHPHVEGPTNLEVLMLARSLASRGYVKMTYNWLYYYCYLTNEGIAYLRQYLALPEDVVPATHRKPAGRPEREEERFGGGEGGGGGGRPAFRGGGDREYRGRAGGFGRGRGGGGDEA